MSKASSFYGTTRKEEEKKLKEIQQIAANKVRTFEQSAAALQEDLKSLREVYDVEDKEGLAQWFNTDARFQEVRNDLNRARRACEKPFFGRIDIEDPETGRQETFYIGKTLIAEDPSRPEVIDWRAPVSSVYYDHSLGECDYKVPRTGIFHTDLKRKRTYEIACGKLLDFYDSDVVANDDLLTRYLSKSKRNVLSEIIATIQQEQNEIIRKDPHHNVLVQGSAGSGKTTVAMHRISYILYNYDTEFKPDGFYIVGSNRVLLNYITGVLPDLDVYGVSQMTMEELLKKLLYEDWDRHTMKIRPIDSLDEGIRQKTTSVWFEELRSFCAKYEESLFPVQDICIEKNGHVIMSGETIKKLFHEYPDWPLWRKFERLNDFLTAGLENEIYGRNYSYEAEEKKKLTRKYRDWFKRFQRTDSVFELYDHFIESQIAAHPGISITYQKNEPDLYDLAGLAYIYKRLKETEVIQEASHVVIDEAQDFGIAVYRSLVYCLSKCTFTVMGDVSQNINFQLGLSDWEELKKVLLPNKFDYFGLLRKSYRNTVEISEFATDILRHGTFPIYPVEPIIRHGEKVSVDECPDNAALTSAVCRKIKQFLEKGYETIAIICRNQKEAQTACRNLNALNTPNALNNRNDPNGSNVPNGFRNPDIRLFSKENGEFSKGICALPIEYAKGLEFDAVIIYDASDKAYPKTDGHVRLLYVAATRALHELAVFSKGALTGLIRDPVPEERKHLSFKEDDFHVAPLVFEEEFKTNEELAAEQAALGDRERSQRDKYGPKKLSPSGHSSLVPKRQSAPQTDISVPKKKHSSTEFDTMPVSTSLTPIGHGKIDNSVRWVHQEKSFVEITGSYGTLRIIPVADETVRILFSKGSFDKMKALPEEIFPEKNLHFTYRESRDSIQITMEKLIIVITRKTGSLAFFTRAGVPLLSENPALSRQYHGSKPVWWEYFAWSKKENLSARGAADNIWKDINQSAKYISHGKDTNRPALIMSSKGYQILVPAGIKTLICTIPAHGPYLCFEDSEFIDYFFRSLR